MRPCTSKGRTGKVPKSRRLRWPKPWMERSPSWFSRKAPPVPARICCRSGRRCSKPRISRRAMSAGPPRGGRLRTGRQRNRLVGSSRARTMSCGCSDAAGTSPVTVRLLAAARPQRPTARQLTPRRESDRAKSSASTSPSHSPIAARMTPKTFKIKSFGCQMNVYDGERMAELLARKAWPRPRRRRCRPRRPQHLPYPREGGGEGLFGCRPPEARGRLEADDRALRAASLRPRGRKRSGASPMIDIVVGPQAYHRLPAMVAEAARGGRPVDTDMPAISKFGALPRGGRASPSRLSHGAGGLRQILHLLRRALHARRRDLRPWGDDRRRRRKSLVERAARARSSCSARM